MQLLEQVAIIRAKSHGKQRKFQIKKGSHRTQIYKILIVM